MAYMMIGLQGLASSAEAWISGLVDLQGVRAGVVLMAACAF